jgi:hypothetical protein
MVSFLHDFIVELRKNLYSLTENLVSNPGQTTPLWKWKRKFRQKLSLTKSSGCAASCSASCTHRLLREYAHIECGRLACNTMPLGFLWSYRQQSSNGWPSSCAITRCLKDFDLSSKLTSGKVSRDSTSLLLADCGWIVRCDWQVKLESTTDLTRTWADCGRWHIYQMYYMKGSSLR